MKLKINKTIEENIITVNIGVSELGTGFLSESEELNLLHDFPRSVIYSAIDFKANMKLNEAGEPVVVTDETDNAVEEVSLTLINKKYPIDENLAISFSLDVAKIPASELGTVFDTVEKLGKARAELFAVKIQEEISNKLNELRQLHTKFEREIETVI